ncbi:MAG: nucleotidyltransferase [Gemmatimonadaceae bacterium]
MHVDQDFVEILSELREAEAEFLVVGAHALAAHGLPRATGDFDLWVRPSRENAARVYRALARYGAPLDRITEADFASPDVVFQIGVEPLRIDVMTTISGVDFDDAWSRKITASLGGREVFVISAIDLMRNKRATGREGDLLDLKRLERRFGHAT